jgi:hypothetical protein
LTVIQKTHGITGMDDPTGYATVSTEGEIRLRKAPKDSEHGKKPYITVDIGTSTNMSILIDWSEDSQTLELSTPRYTEKYLAESQCLYVEITAWFPEDAEFTNLRFDSTTLNMALSDIKVNVTGRSKFTTLSGEVWLPSGGDDSTVSGEAVDQLNHPAMSSKPRSDNPSVSTNLQFSSRRIVVETISGSITGNYPLLDDLLLSSQSGEITVEVSPQAASKSAPAPADLEVQTASGTIRVDLPFKGANYLPPSRDYITRVHSTSGSIYGSYYLGSESSFKTTSGTIDITTLPVLPAGSDGNTMKVPPNVFETHTVSGTTKISVLEPIFFSALSLTHQTPPVDPYLPSNGDDPYTNTPSTVSSSPALSSEPIPKKPKLRSLRSAHSSNTGQIIAQYPDAWQGSIHAKTVSGDIVVKGEGFRTVKARKGWAFREVLKRRGVESAGEGCFVEMSNISGEVEFDIVPG